MRALGLVLRLGFWTAVLCTPLVGSWLAGSLAAFVNGPRWAVVLAALVLFPIGPLAWEAWAALRRRRRLARSDEGQSPGSGGARRRVVHAPPSIGWCCGPSP